MIRCDKLRETVQSVAAETQRRCDVMRERLRQCGALAVLEPDVVRPQSLAWHGRLERGQRGAHVKIVGVPSGYGVEVALYQGGKRYGGSAVYRASETGFRDALLLASLWLRTGKQTPPASPDLTPQASPA